MTPLPPPWSLAPPRLDACDRPTLRAYFRNAWDLNELLFASLADEEALQLQPDPLRNPLVFYWGHTAAFYVNKLRLAGLADRGVDVRLDELLALGVDPASIGDLDADKPWPRKASVVRGYRDCVRDLVEDVIDRVPLPDRITDTDPAWALLMGIEHARIHFETSSVLLRQVPADRLRRPKNWRYAEVGGSAPPRRWVDVPGSVVQLGRDLSDPLFGWDNEFGHDERRVVTFQASSHLVTHQEFDGFVADGGYRERSLWTDDGWEWRRAVGAERPRFIDANGGHRALFDHMPRPAAWPVEVNAHEAAAFCAWIGDGARLPTEAEWALLAARSPRRLSEGGGLRTDLDNLALRWGSPSSVEACPEGAVEPGIHDVFGNVWEWLSDEFSPLPGFRSHRLYEDFSAPYFGTEHGMMAGGSWATTGAGASPWYRLWFRRHFYQHAGFRPVRSVTRSTSPSIGD